MTQAISDPSNSPTPTHQARTSQIRLLLEGGRVNQAEALLQSLLLSPESRDLTRLERVELLCLQGQCQEAQGMAKEATNSYQSALQAEPGHVGALKPLIRLEVDVGRADEAQHLITALLAHHRHTLPDDELYQVYLTLARLRQRLGDHNGARAAVENGLRCCPSSKEARDLLISFHRQSGNWEKVAEHLRRILHFSNDPDDQFGILLEMGDIYRDRLGHVDEADACYQAAVALAPHDPLPRERRILLYQRAGRIREELRELTSLAASGTDTVQRARLYLQMGRIYRDRLDDRQTAVACLNQALDLNPTLQEAFEEGALCLLEASDWRGLEAQYRLMLGRLSAIEDPPPDSSGAGQDPSHALLVREAGFTPLPETGHMVNGPNSTLRDLRGILWRNLADVYCHQLQDHKNGAIALEVACSHRPHDLDARLLLGRLWNRMPQISLEKKAGLYQEILHHHPEHPEALAGLRDAYLGAEQLDPAWCVETFRSCCITEEGETRAGAKSLERRAPLPQRPGPLRFLRGLGDQEWHQWIRHPAEHIQITQLMAQLGHLVGKTLGRSLKEHGVSPKDFLSPAVPLAIFAYLGPVMRLLNLGPVPPAFYQTPHPTGDARLLATITPSILVGPDVLGGGSGSALAFRLGRALTIIRPEYLLVRLVPPFGLARLLESIGVTVCPDLVLQTPLWPEQHLGQPDSVPTNAIHHLKKAITSPQGAPLAQAAERLQRQSVSVDLNRWISGVSLTADRAGLLACEDPKIARQLTCERWTELRSFAISSDYFNARAHLGVSHSCDLQQEREDH